MDLQTSIRDAGRWYKRYAFALEKLGIYKIEDFLYHFPSRYDDFSLISTIAQLQPGETVTIRGVIADIKNTYTKNGIILQKAKVQDKTGAIDVIWFNQPYLTKVIQVNNDISLSGKASIFVHNLVLESPEYEILPKDNLSHKTIHTGRLVPIYPETKGISSKWIRRQIDKIIKNGIQNISEYISSSIREKYNFMPIQDAIKKIHFPTNLDEANKARERLAFDELLEIQTVALLRKKDWEKQKNGMPFTITSFKKQIEEFWKKLPFELTRAQKRAVKDIFADLASNKPMNRLLEGDVGSGKTVVSAIAMYLAYLNGYQSVLMAPTEILAQQHYQTIQNLLSPFGVKVELVTGSKKFKVQSSKFKVLIGTHAVLSDKINFERLGLVVIDEQQRFGVEQRTKIRKKGQNPHLLTMTATPIPRTVALTMYGDLDLSLLDEMPKGRKTVKTWLVHQEKRNKAYEWIRSQLSETSSREAGSGSARQLFVICPFIEESENMQTVKAAKKEYERLQKNVFPELKLGLLHGRLKAKEKETVLENFRNKKFDILVATPVVEVGIDIPSATIILIEASERFGLAQLHQLRGRVGRGDKQSYCLLFTESSSEQTLKRLRAMETLHVGAELAELDLRLRGPGQLYGTMQHGAAKLKIANFADRILIERTKREAENIINNIKQHTPLLEKIKKINIKQVSPD